MCDLNIENLEQLISDRIGCDKIIVDTKISNLNQAGENYLSIIIKLDITLQNKHGIEEDLHAIAKCVINDDNEQVRDMTTALMKSEVLCYKRIIPAIQSFQVKYGFPEIEIFAECFGARFNLTDEDEIADKDAVIILENLRYKDYTILDRHIGFDLDGSKSVLSDLAALHGTCLAMKLLEPELFDSKIRKNISPRPSPPGDSTTGPPSQLKLMRKILQGDKEFGDFSKFDSYIERELERIKTRTFFNLEEVEPFSTFVHSDFWLNNIMHIVSDGKLIENKILDFQLGAVASPVCDLLFFLISSVRIDDLKRNFEDLLQFYHGEFVERLTKFGCYSETFCYHQFLLEMEQAAPQVLLQSMYMTANIVFCPKGKFFDHSKSHEVKVEDVHPVAREKICFLMKEAAKRNWI